MDAQAKLQPRSSSSTARYCQCACTNQCYNHAAALGPRGCTDNAANTRQLVQYVIEDVHYVYDLVPHQHAPPMLQHAITHFDLNSEFHHLLKCSVERNFREAGSNESELIIIMYCMLAKLSRQILVPPAPSKPWDSPWQCFLLLYQILGQSLKASSYLHQNPGTVPRSASSCYIKPWNSPRRLVPASITTWDSPCRLLRTSINPWHKTLMLGKNHLKKAGRNYCILLQYYYWEHNPARSS